jgi:ribosomal protein S27E
LATALLLGLGLILALAALVSIGFFLRRRIPARTVSAGSTDQPAKQVSVLVTCPECEKKLKIKTGLAGKKVKCPACGKLVLVPAAAPALTEGSAGRKEKQSS